MQKQEQEQHIQESIDEMSETEVRESCFEFAENFSLLLESAGLPLDSDIKVHELANMFKLQGIEQLVTFLSQMKKTNEKFSVESFIETISGYSKFANTEQDSSIKTIH